MKRWIVAFLLGASLVVALAQTPQRPSQKPAESKGRFLLVPAEIDAGPGTGGAITHKVFLIDSQTGRVWRFDPGALVEQEGKMVSYPEMFVPVGISRWTPPVREDLHLDQQPPAR
jgi:hypothetical protein